MVYLNEIWRKIKKPLTYVLATAGLLAIGYVSCQGIKALTGGKGRETTLESKLLEEKMRSERFVLNLIKNVKALEDSLKQYIPPETVKVEVPVSYVPYSTPTPAPTPEPEPEWRGQPYVPNNTKGDTREIEGK